ncbi:MAG TPA: OmpA family protein [Chitinivibrionales bacterium]|nr:OmpA family protein [Chitinivibrionales bacterium]
MANQHLQRALALIAVLGCLWFSWAAQEEKSDEGPNPTFTADATRGLVHTPSAETVGAGRLSFSVFGSWYKQQIGYTLTPNAGSNIIVGTGAFSFGINPWFDVFGQVNGFGSVDYKSSPAAGLGAVQAGVMGALPLPEASPFHLGAQASIVGGTSFNQLDSNAADGFDYFETRTGYDFIGRVLESAVFGTEEKSFKIHLNEGAVYSLQKDKKAQLLLGLGLQGNVHEIITLGLEVNSLTFLNNVAFKTDPVMVTPSIVFRTPFYMNFLLGADIAASQARPSGQPRALEPYRVFAGIDFTFDLLAGKRKADREAQRKAELDREEQTRKAAHLQEVADGLAKKVIADSIAAAQAREAEKRRADSLAAKSKRDSMELADTKKRLSDEVSKRSDMEKQLLSTGLLILDAVYFETGKTEISINSKPYLNIIGKMLLKYPKLQLEVGGHTDNIGKYEANKRLSNARAESVRSYLVSVAPELASRLSAAGYGPDVPKADNRSAAGRKINRRVELQVMNKEVLKEYNQ